MTKQSGVPEPGRVLEPSNDTTRIATALRLLAGRSPPAFAGPPNATHSWPPLSAAVVEAVISARALRSAYVPAELLSDPAWDMLLELLHAEITKRRVTTSILSKAAGIRTSAGLRWIETLIMMGLCAWSKSPDHGFVQLTDQGSGAVRAYFAKLQDSLEPAAPDDA